MAPGYDVAQVCLNGHVINAKTCQYPERSQDFCAECGERGIASCPRCGESIRGAPLAAEWVWTYQPPNYCGGCGQPLPWTKSRLKAAHDLVRDLGGLDDDERQLLEESIDQLALQTPAADSAAIRFKTLISKARGPAVTLLQQVVVQLASSYVAGQLGLT